MRRRIGDAVMAMDLLKSRAMLEWWLWPVVWLLGAALVVPVALAALPMFLKPGPHAQRPTVARRASTPTPECRLAGAAEGALKHLRLLPWLLPQDARESK